MNAKYIKPIPKHIEKKIRTLDRAERLALLCLSYHHTQGACQNYGRHAQQGEKDAAYETGRHSRRVFG